jgi:hypothetical protein
MISESTELDILRNELRTANQTIDYLRDELLFQARGLNQAYDSLYDAIVLLASCDSCSDESLPWLQNRCSESERSDAIAQALGIRDKRNAYILLDVGIDLEAWTQPEGETEAQED